MCRGKRESETGKGRERKGNKGLERNVYMFVGFLFFCSLFFFFFFSFDAFVGAVVFVYFVAHGRGGWG